MVQIFGIEVSLDAFLTVLQAAALAVVTFAVARLVRRLFRKYEGDATGRSAKNLSRLLQAIVYIAGLLAIGATLHVDISSLIIGLGAVSIAVSFALSTILNNLVAGFLIQADGSIRIGDDIAVGGLEGRVVRMRARTTMLVTKDGALIFVPNAYFMTNPVVNRGRATAG